MNPQTQEQAYQVAVNAMAMILTWLAWLFTIALLAVDSVLLVTHFDLVPCLFAFTGAWLFFLGSILGKSKALIEARKDLDTFATKQVTNLDSYARLGCVLVNMDESYAISKELVGNDQIRYWLLHSDDAGETWYKVDYFGSDVKVIDFDKYRKSKLHDEHEGA